MNWISGVLNVVGEPIKGWQERKTLKLQQRYEIDRLDHEAGVARANARLEMAKQGQSQDYDLDRIATRNMQNSWKDELILIVFLTPVVMAFIPGMDEVVKSGFSAIEAMPEWYIGIVIGMVVVIYGMRGLLKAYLQRGLGHIKQPSRPGTRNN